jgi:carbamoyltransferase
MRILGISDHFTSGAAVIEDGRVIAAVAEERVARKKMVMGFPRLAIREVLELSGTAASDLTSVAVASHWGHLLRDHVSFDKGVFGVDEGLLKGLFFFLGSHLSFLRSRLPILERLYYDLRKPIYARRKAGIRRILREELDITAPVEFVSHHYAHAVGAYWGSGYDEALLVTLDGAGDGDSSHIYDAAGGVLRHLHSVPSFDSVGDYYAYVTHICGFTAGKHEGKITGLAAYGEPRYRQIFDRFITYENGTIVNTGNTFRHAAIKKLLKALPRDYAREHLAATVQDVAESIASRYVSHWRERTGRRNVALAGGVFANVKINQRVYEIDGVESVYVYPAMSDEGIAAGAALADWMDRRPAGERRLEKCFDHVYLGPEFSDREIERALQDSGLVFARSEQPEAEIARLISDGYVVARFAGRMEYGPRALGNRSILYRPDEPSVNDWLNKRLRRTEFMPFAPSTISEDADKYYLNLEGARETARFMTITFDCTPFMKERCAGVVHVDGTARPQLVSESDNPSYYAILQEFKRLTGLSSFVNTSFNIHEEPIVRSPQDAIRAFTDGHLDVLAIGPFMVRNPEAEKRVGAMRRTASTQAVD